MSEREAPAHRALRAMRSVAHCAGEVLLWVTRRRARIRVSGASMSPTIETGDHLFYRKLGARSVPVGSVVVLRHSVSPCQYMVKRVSAHHGGGLWVSSDGAGMGSERLGIISKGDIVGLVTSSVGSRGFQRLMPPRA